MNTDKLATNKPATEQTCSYSPEISTCCICLEDMTDKFITLRCKHQFHDVCIINHFRHNNNKCPYCRDTGKDVTENVENNSSGFGLYEIMIDTIELNNIDNVNIDKKKIIVLKKQLKEFNKIKKDLFAKIYPQVKDIKKNNMSIYKKKCQIAYDELLCNCKSDLINLKKMKLLIKKNYDILKSENINDNNFNDYIYIKLGNGIHDAYNFTKKWLFDKLF